MQSVNWPPLGHALREDRERLRAMPDLRAVRRWIAFAKTA